MDSLGGKRLKKNRADLVLVQRGLVLSREKAQALIMAGKVLLNDEPLKKSGQLIKEQDLITIKEQDHPYVSRGGLKLEAALKEFKISVKDRTALDVGSSTGGFTDVLLQFGARHVFAIDVGTNQMAWSLRRDPRVTLQEGVNARHLKFDNIGKKVDLIVADLSFISILKVLPALLLFCDPSTDWVILVKPQFEVGREDVGKGGIVKDNEVRLKVLENVISEAKKLGLVLQGKMKSPILGTKGNEEFLVYFKKP